MYLDNVKPKEDDTDSKRNRSVSEKYNKSST